MLSYQYKFKTKHAPWIYKYGVKVITGLSNIAVSSDGYIRLTLKEFQKISLVHLISGLDEDKPILLKEGATFAEITGYTEWITDTVPAISIGWDWIIQPLQTKVIHYKRTSEPRSNLMLINSQRCDLGSARNAQLIETVIDEIAWQSVVQQFISARYAS